LIYSRRKRSAKASRTNGASPSMEPFSLLSDSIKRRTYYFAILKRHIVLLFFNASWKYGRERLVR
jgi:hypothetical protein